MKNIILCAILISGLHFNTSAQFLENLDRKVKNQVKTRVNNNVDQILDGNMNKAEKAIKDKVAGKPAAEADDAEGKAVQSGPMAAAQAEPGNAKAKVVSNSKYDFIPGEKILYDEDFSDGLIGEMPANWNAGGNGQVVTIDGIGGKWLRMFPGTKYLSGNEKELGENYTVEFDVLLDGTAPSGTRYLPEMEIGLLSSAGKSTTDNSFLRGHPENVAELYFKPNVDASSRIRLESRALNGSVTFKTENVEFPHYGKTIGKIAHYAIQIQKLRMRFWVDGVKIFDVPRAVNVTPVLNQLYFNIKEYWPYNESNYGMYVTNIKIATGLPDMRSKLMDTGKFSTNGILFAVNSDQVQPQSMGTIQAIAQILKENPDVRIKIIGHTDSDGESTANLSLSRSRALAVKSILEKEFDIESSRLEADGKGENEPVEKGTSKESKALNRRVEFIKI